MKNKGVVVGVTWGDPAGVGPELARHVFRKLGRSLSLRRIGHGESRPGKPTLAGGQVAKEALLQSVDLLLSTSQVGQGVVLVHFVFTTFLVLCDCHITIILSHIYYDN